MIDEVIIAAAAAGMFWVMTMLFDVAISVTIATTVFIILQALFCYFYLRTALEPIKVLTSAIIHISGQETLVQPPNINQKRYKENGLKAMVQTIYDIKSQAHSDSQPPAADHAADNILKALPIGIIALDAKRRVIYNNDLAPVINEDGHTRVQLIFDNEKTNSLVSWLNQVEKAAVSDEHIWTRVQNVVPGDDNRRLYDVIAHYKKGAPSGVETIIVTVDRTATYGDDETSMDFIALAAHELRGPITVIRGYLESLDEELGPHLTSEQRGLLDRLYVSGNRLSGYINNILNASRYDRRHLKLALQETSIENIINGIKSDVSLRAQILNRRLTFEIPHDLPTVAADISSISEVMTNLIDNAIKYSSDGGEIQISSRRDGDFVAISITDHGIGIPGAVVGQLFDKFYRSHRSRSAVNGTGLGLYISRAIVESHGGEIGVRSREGEGSTFTFTLPIYSTVADKLAEKDNSEIVKNGGSWIRNHNMFKG